VTRRSTIPGERTAGRAVNRERMPCLIPRAAGAGYPGDAIGKIKLAIPGRSCHPSFL
jgi:hypothetical protein